MVSLGVKAVGLTVLSSLASTVHALGQKQIIAFTSGTETFQIAGGSSSPGQIRVSPNEYWGVIRAAGDLAVDFGRVTGTNFTLSNGVNGASPAAYTYLPVNVQNNTFFSTTAQQAFLGPNYAQPNADATVIIAGTIGHSQVIDDLINAGRINVTEIKGQWESFISQVIREPIPGCSRALVIAGSDPRGTIYGIYDVSEQIGVSPWYFWADVPVKKNSNIYVVPGLKVQGPPSIKYRGVFLNDEQPELTNWVATTFGDAWNGAAGYTAPFYALVCEVLLRLRANYLWPTLWGSMVYVDDAANQPLIDAYEVVLGSSHTEPMMRAQNEFKTFYQSQWAYNLNNKTIDEYFRYGVQRAKPYVRNSLFTMAMRGTGDSAIEGGLGVDAIVTMLEKLVENQRRIIAEGLEIQDVTTVPQVWCLYKEVQSYQENGLVVPEDITLLWADDNWGNIRRMPLRNETDRVGGAGVYYHFDYVGVVRSYKWINTIQLEKTAEQMYMAYARGAQRIWVVNVGDLKKLEIPINHFFDLAYDAKRWGVDGTQDWVNAWVSREFGGNFTTTITSIMTRYGMYAARRKFELVEPQTYSVINYHEADAVLEQWSILAGDAQGVYDKLEDEYKPAFFEMILHPILAAEIIHKIHVTAAKNSLWSVQKRNAANDLITQSLALLDEDADLTVRWDGVKGGKWKHMADQTHLGHNGYWQQPMRDTLPAMTYVQTRFVSLAGHVGVSIEGSNATVPGDDRYHGDSVNDLTLPPMDPYGPITRYFDVFHRGTNSCSWSAAPWVPWVHLSAYNGSTGPNGTDTRVFIRVDWAAAPRAPSATTVNINITTPCRGLDKYGFQPPKVLLPVVNRLVPPNLTSGFVESDGHVAIEGPHYSAVLPPTSPSNASTGLHYRTLTNYGRTMGGVGLYPPETEKLAVGEGPALEYDVYLFTNTSAANVTLYLSPSQNYLTDQNPLEYAISLFPKGSADQPAPKIVQPVGRTFGGNMPAGWGNAVADSVWGLKGNLTTSSFNVTHEGAYTLRIWCLLPSIVIQKVVIDLGGVRASYLGPPESFLVGRDRVGEYNQTSFLNSPGILGGVGNEDATRRQRVAA